MRLSFAVPVALAACGLCLQACGSDRTADADPQMPVRAAAVTDSVYRADFRQTLLLSGELRARYGESIRVPALPSWETTIRWMIDDGAEVLEGDRVVELDTAQIASELENKITAQQQALNALATAEAEIEGALAQKQFTLESARIALRKAEIDADVPQDVTDRKTYEEAQLALEQARVEYEKAQADVDGHGEASEAELETLRVDLRKAEREVEEARRAIDAMALRAPQSGIAVVSENRREDRKFQVGDTIWVGATVLEIPDLRAMTVEARLSDVDDGKVTPGMTVQAVLDAYPDREFSGVVRDVSPVAHEAGWRSDQRNFVVLVDLDESDPEIMQPGMSARIEVRTATQEDALLVPRIALEFADDGAYAVVQGGERVAVELGSCNATACVVRSGLTDGQRVEEAR